MMKITINVPDEITFSSGNADFAFKLADVAADKLVEWAGRAFIAGLVKTGVDAAAGAAEYAKKNADVPGMNDTVARQTLVGKRMDAWKRGEWLARGTGDGVDELTKIAIGLTAEAVSKSDARKYKSADPKERAAMRATYFEGLNEAQKATLMKAATATLDIRRKRMADLEAVRLAINL
jgi:hypothetical protein